MTLNMPPWVADSGTSTTRYNATRHRALWVALYKPILSSTNSKRKFSLRHERGFRYHLMKIMRLQMLESPFVTVRGRLHYRLMAYAFIKIKFIIISSSDSIFDICSGGCSEGSEACMAEMAKILKFLTSLCRLRLSFVFSPLLSLRWQNRS